jgi:hypothetical protein
MPVVFLQPVVMFEDRATLGATDRQIYDITSIADPFLSSWGEIRAMLPGLFGAAGIEFHDIGQIGGSADTHTTHLYIDYCHLSPQGAQRVAELMYPAVMRRVEIGLAQRGPGN